MHPHAAPPEANVEQNCKLSPARGRHKRPEAAIFSFSPGRASPHNRQRQPSRFNLVSIPVGLVKKKNGLRLAEWHGDTLTCAGSSHESRGTGFVFLHIISGGMGELDPFYFRCLRVCIHAVCLLPTSLLQHVTFPVFLGSCTYTWGCDLAYGVHPAATRLSLSSRCCEQMLLSSVSPPFPCISTQCTGDT